MVDEETVEQVDVIRLQGGKVEVFVYIRSSAVDHSQRSLALGIHALEDVRDQAGEILGYSVVGIE